MALEQFSIVLGVVFGFWAGFITRSSMLFISFVLSIDLHSLNSPRFFVVAHSARHPNHPGYHPRSGMPFPPTLASIISAPGAVR